MPSPERLSGSSRADPILGHRKHRAFGSRAGKSLGAPSSPNTSYGSPASEGFGMQFVG